MTDALDRIAAALERLTPPLGATVAQNAAAYRWNGATLAPVEFAPLPLALLGGIDAQRDAVLTNTQRLAQGHGAHDVLLWGARGAGKSALVKSVVGAVQAGGGDVALVEIATDGLGTLPALFDQVAAWQRSVIIFIDDLAFDHSGTDMRSLRSVLEGGASARPPRVRLYVTSNKRNIVARDMAEQASAINGRDVADDQLALADRFGLSLGFHVCDQDTYVAIVTGYAAHLGLAFDPADAVQWATQRGSRSGRVAWHYAVELAGRAGIAL